MGKRVISAMIVGLLSGCAPPDVKQDGGPAAETDHLPFEWREGSGGSKFTSTDRMAIRCWPDGSEMECLRVLRIDAREGEGGTRNYVRFRWRGLPSDLRSIEQLERLDGYECDVRGRTGSRKMVEYFWRDGNVADQRRSQEAINETAWNAADRLRLFLSPGVRVQRSYLPCLHVDAIVSRDGLAGIDTPMLGPVELSGGSTFRRTGN